MKSPATALLSLKMISQRHSKNRCGYDPGLQSGRAGAAQAARGSQPATIDHKDE